jgi:hypothetical protein
MLNFIPGLPLSLRADWLAKLVAEIVKLKT